jgi:hypothetical protein
MAVPLLVHSNFGIPSSLQEKNKAQHQMTQVATVIKTKVDGTEPAHQAQAKQAKHEVSIASYRPAIALKRRVEIK